MNERASHGHRALLAALGVLLASMHLAGCAVSSYTTADTLAAGSSQFWVAPQVLRVGVAAAPENMPFVELGSRFGLTDAVELGLRVGAGAQVDAKIALRKRAPGRDLTIAVAPGFGYIGNFSGTPTGADGDDLHFVGATLPVHLSYRLHDALQISVGPRVAWMMQYVETASAATTHTVALGSSLNLAWRVSPGLQIVPEVAVAVPFLRGLTGAGTVWGSGGQRVIQLGIGFVLGGAAD